MGLENAAEHKGTGKGREKRDMIKSPLWPNAVVYYTIDTASFGFDPSYITTINNVLNEYRKRTCIKFISFSITSTPPAPGYVLFKGDTSGGYCNIPLCIAPFK